ncbi:unnamed protein product [Adineta steineri]|uniref:Uncharacterized protein n=1 Tax=Adineta steineri TaxID=433720 RepID=A0A813ZE35_9BILA|nr:unnamed protein product [Adineta steineri]CAF0916819.1 unnamed protein product [Adineta steineri]
MNKHHEELIKHFEQLIGVQKELKESFNIIESTWQTEQEHPCLTTIDQWEQEIITRIQQIAENARQTTHEMMTKNMVDIRSRLDQLAIDMEQRQQEKNYLDNDVVRVKHQLEQLDHTIKHINEKIRINYSATNKVDWNSLIYVTADKKFMGNRFNLSELNNEQESSQEKIWNNLRKLIKTKYININDRDKQINLKHDTSVMFEPITLTSYGSSLLKENSNLKSETTISNNTQANPFLNNDPFNYSTFTILDSDPFLPHTSDA